jgi:hypothetical protein
VKVFQIHSNYNAHPGGFSAGATTGDGGANYGTHGNTSGKNTGGVAPMLSQDDNGNDSAITRSGVSAGTLNVYDVLDPGASVLALRAQVPLKMGVADGLNRPRTMFGVTVPRMNNNTLIPFVNTAAPYGTTQAISILGIASKAATAATDVNQAGEKK